MLSRFLRFVYLRALYAYLYIQSCLLMAASSMEDRFANTADRHR